MKLKKVVIPLFLFLLLAQIASAYYLVYKDGRRVETHTRPSVAGEEVVWMDEDGRQRTVRAEKIDLKETMTLNNRLDNGRPRRKVTGDELPKEGKIWVVGKGTGNNLKSFFWQLKRLYEEPTEESESKGRWILISFQFVAWMVATVATIRAVRWLGGSEEGGVKIFLVNLVAALILILFGGVAFGMDLLKGGGVDLVAFLLAVIPIAFLYRWSFLLPWGKTVLLVIVQFVTAAFLTVLAVVGVTLLGFDLSDLRF